MFSVIHITLFPFLLNIFVYEKLVWIKVISFLNQRFFICFNLLIPLCPCKCNNYVRSRSFYWSFISIQFQCPFPVLTLRRSGAQAVVGDMIKLHHQALRGSPPNPVPVLLQKDITLGPSQLPLEKESLSTSLWLQNILETSVRLTMVLGCTFFITGKSALTQSTHRDWPGKCFSKTSPLGEWLSNSLCSEVTPNCCRRARL